MRFRQVMMGAAALVLCVTAGAAGDDSPSRPGRQSRTPRDGAETISLPSRVFVVPNFHPASCGWLTNWSAERDYCANTYLDHLDRVRDDPNYEFVLSECNNQIAILNFEPERFAELRERLKEGRVELVNAFFLELTCSLSGGEALAKMGIEGLRWQQQVMGVRPRFLWAIDLCGTHDQMPQLAASLGLEALVYTRCSRADKNVFWSESPDGSRILTLVPGHYSEDLGGAYQAKEPLTVAQLGETAKFIAAKVPVTPAGAPVLILAGSGDYSLAPARRENPTEFLRQWRSFRPGCDLRFTTLSKYIDALLPGVRSGDIKLATVRGGTGYTFDSFWIENPRVKSWYRRDEHALQAAETLATIASLKAGADYPVVRFYQAWLQMLLNTDRNTLWGSAGGMVFEHETSWDARDRLAWVETASAAALEAAARRLAGDGEDGALFNPANWDRTDPLRLKLPSGKRIADAAGEAAEDGTTLLQVEVPATGVVGVKFESGSPAVPKSIDAPTAIETAFYSARLDPATGAIVSLKTKPSGREMLGGPANVIVAEERRGSGDPGDFMDPRPKRPRRASSSDFKPAITATEGPLAITVSVRSEFLGGAPSRRLMRFYKNHPRIEFETELNDIPNLTVVVAEFPLAAAPTEVRRGIPFGFAHGAWAQPNPELHGWVKGITPAVRWSDYSLPGGGGVALLDRGLTGREINDKTPVIYLLNATDKYYGYPNSWLSGRGSHPLEYALVAHEADWDTARIPQLAWEYNCPVTIVAGCAAPKRESFVRTSDNVLVEVVRRDGADIEMRLEECLGRPGPAEVTLDLPHERAEMTDLVGQNTHKLEGGPHHSFLVRPQQIITLRFRTASPVAKVEPLTEWDELVPAGKRAALHDHRRDRKGHPPKGE
jgi:alpha-mannosidase